jgi:hypothetical protein
MERHLIAQYPTYLKYQRRVPSPFFPWFALHKANMDGSVTPG